MWTCVLWLTSQGATGAAGGHLPAAEAEPGGAGGGDGGRHGGAAEALHALRPRPSLPVTAATQLTILECKKDLVDEFPKDETVAC